MIQADYGWVFFKRRKKKKKKKTLVQSAQEVKPVIPVQQTVQTIVPAQRAMPMSDRYIMSEPEYTEPEQAEKTEMEEVETEQEKKNQYKERLKKFVGVIPEDVEASEEYITAFDGILESKNIITYALLGIGILLLFKKLK